jgi:hypothetical protein
MTDYPVNSYVLYNPPMDRSNKLIHKYKKTVSSHRKEAINIHHQGSCSQSATLHIQPYSNQEFIVEGILAHRGNHHRRSTMEFLVRLHGKIVGKRFICRPISFSMSGTAISPGWIYHLVASSKTSSSGSYWISQESLNLLRPKPAFPSSGILSVIKVLKLRSPVIKSLKLSSPVKKKS